MTPAMATAASRTSPAAPPAKEEGAADRVIEIDLRQTGGGNDAVSPLTAARLEELAQVIRLR